MQENRLNKAEFLAETYRLKERSAVSFIFNHIHQLLFEGKYQEVNGILAEADVIKLDTNGILSFLTITMCV